MLKIVYACNDGYFDGLYLSILSLLRRTKESVSISLLTADFTDIKSIYTPLSNKHKKIISDLLKLYNKKNNFKVYDLTHLYKKTFKNDNNLKVKKYSPYTMLRLLIDKVPDFKGVYLYIDIDTLINGDIKEAYADNIKHYEIIACHDRNLGKRCNGKYFNAGIMLMNMDLIRKTKLFEKSWDFYLKNRPLLADQAALNECVTKIGFWENEYRFNYQKPSIESNTIVKHFLNTARVKFWTRYIKPWHPNKVMRVLKLHNWDEDYKIYFMEKQKW